MKLIAWEKEKPTPGIIRLRLVERDGFIELMVVDREGKRVERGSLLKIHEEGTFMRMENTNEKLGFKLTEDGQIQLTEEVEE